MNIFNVKKLWMGSFIALCRKLCGGVMGFKYDNRSFRFHSQLVRRQHWDMRSSIANVAVIATLVVHVLCLDLSHSPRHHTVDFLCASNKKNFASTICSMDRHLFNYAIRFMNAGCYGSSYKNVTDCKYESNDTVTLSYTCNDKREVSNHILTITEYCKTIFPKYDNPGNLTKISHDVAA